MSFDLFVGCFRNGEKATFRRSLVDEHFGQYVTAREPNCLTLTFEDKWESYLYADDADVIESLCINRPAASEELFSAMMSFLRSESLVLYMPGNCPPLVADESVIAHLPKDMVASLGTPVLLSSWHDIPKKIQEA